MQPDAMVCGDGYLTAAGDEQAVVVLGLEKVGVGGSGGRVDYCILTDRKTSILAPEDQ